MQLPQFLDWLLPIADRLQAVHPTQREMTSIEHVILTIKSVFLGVFLLLVLVPSLLGSIVAHVPIIGVLLLAGIFAVAYMGVRLSRDSRRHWAIRRLSLVTGICCILLSLAAIPSTLIESGYARFEDWHSAGAGLRAGMTLEEARGVLAQKSTVTEFAVEEPRNFKGVRFQVEPTGLAGYKFSFPLAELFYLDVEVDPAGRVATVKSWHD